MWVKIMYWSSDSELIFSKHFHSITDHIFHFKIWLWFSGLLNRKIDSDIKVLNHILLMLAKPAPEWDRTCLVEEWAFSFAEAILKHFSCFRLLLRKTRLSVSHLNFIIYHSNFFCCKQNRSFHKKRFSKFF
jgi:hypothetical protein